MFFMFVRNVVNCHSSVLLLSLLSFPVVEAIGSALAVLFIMCKLYCFGPKDCLTEADGFHRQSVSESLMMLCRAIVCYSVTCLGKVLWIQWVMFETGYVLCQCVEWDVKPYSLFVSVCIGRVAVWLKLLSLPLWYVYQLICLPKPWYLRYTIQSNKLFSVVVSVLFSSLQKFCPRSFV